MIIHKKCEICGKIGHAVDMLCENYGGYMDYYFHPACYASAKGKEKCPCGKGWLSKKKAK